MTTHGRFSDFTICIATEVFPEPEEPATPMIVTSSHGGEYRTSVVEEMRGGLDSIVTSCQNRECWHGRLRVTKLFWVLILNMLILPAAPYLP